MTNNQTTFTPQAQWAQRNNLIFFTINVEDCRNPTIKLEPTILNFSGEGGADHKKYELKVELNGEIDPTTSEHSVHGRMIEFILKKTKDGYWPRLTKSSNKQHWLKVDFDKWKEEDGSDEEEVGGPGGFGGMGGGMGGMGMGGGMGGMGMGGGMGGMGMGGDMDFEKMMREMGGLGANKPGLGDLNDEAETDSDDEEALPELE